MCTANTFMSETSVYLSILSTYSFSRVIIISCHTHIFTFPMFSHRFLLFRTRIKRVKKMNAIFMYFVIAKVFTFISLFSSILGPLRSFRYSKQLQETNLKIYKIVNFNNKIQTKKLHNRFQRTTWNL